MNATEESRTPFDAPGTQLVSLRRFGRVTRNWLLAAAAVVAFVDLVGEPLLRWEYRYHGNHENPIILDATYIGISGARPAGVDQMHDRFPVLAFAKPRRPLWRRILDRATSLIS